MTFDESNAKLTEELTGRTIDCVVRSGKDIEILTTCGHKIILASDVEYNIHYKRTDISIIVNLSGISAKSTS